MGIDMFINQLIQSGLADYSCLDLISDHYLKILEVYEIIQNINISSNDITYNARLDKRNDIFKNNNIVSIEIYNDKYESEVDLYETRFARHKETDNSQWS